MADRLSPLDASFLFMEESTTPMHVGGLMTFDDTPDFDPDRFVAQIGERLAGVPRYRQKIREVPVHLGLPVWVDDPGFELDYHVRRSALPAPGSDAQLRELVGRLMSRQLDRARPLWEIYLVEGLVRRPVRDRHQDPPRDGRRAVVDRRRHGAAGRHADPARVPARRLAPRARAVRPRARRRRRAGAAAAGPS